MKEISYTKAELEELASDQDSTSVSALLNESDHKDAETLRRRANQAAAALFWAAQKLGE